MFSSSSSPAAGTEAGIYCGPTLDAGPLQNKPVLPEMRGGTDNPGWERHHKPTDKTDWPKRRGDVKTDGEKGRQAFGEEGGGDGWTERDGERGGRERRMEGLSRYLLSVPPSESKREADDGISHVRRGEREVERGCDGALPLK